MKSHDIISFQNMAVQHYWTFQKINLLQISKHFQTSHYIRDKLASHHVTLYHIKTSHHNIHLKFHDIYQHFLTFSSHVEKMATLTSQTHDMTIWHHFISHNITSHDIPSHPIISHHIITHSMTLYHITPHYITSHDIKNTSSEETTRHAWQC